MHVRAFKEWRAADHITWMRFTKAKAPLFPYDWRWLNAERFSSLRPRVIDAYNKKRKIIFWKRFFFQEAEDTLKGHLNKRQLVCKRMK